MKNLPTKVNNTQYLYNQNGYDHNSFEGRDNHTEASGRWGGMVIAPTVLKTCYILLFFHLYFKLLWFFEIMKVQVILYLLLLFPGRDETWFHCYSLLNRGYLSKSYSC